MNDGGNVNNPTKAADAGTGFLMNLGYAIAGNGWDMQVTPKSASERPARHHRSGREEPGRLVDHRPSYGSINFDNAKGVRYELAYPAATLDKSKATLTVRARLDDKPATMPRATGNTSTRTRSPAARRHPVQAKPRLRVHVHGKGSGRRRARSGGHARFRVFSQERGRRRLRHPESARRQHAEDVFFTFSQPARYINDFQTFGFNEDEQRPEGDRRRAELDWRRQRGQHQLPLRADRKNRAQPPESPVSGRRVPVRLSGTEDDLSGRRPGAASAAR